jgi:hypothetical protein
VASTFAQQLIVEIRKIARSHAPLSERRAAAAKRINQFIADLAVAGVQPSVAKQLKESLRRTLQRSASHHDLTAQENSVFAEALDVLLAKSD